MGLGFSTYVVHLDRTRTTAVFSAYEDEFTVCSVSCAENKNMSNEKLHFIVLFIKKRQTKKKKHASACICNANYRAVQTTYLSAIQPNQCKNVQI